MSFSAELELRKECLDNITGTSLWELLLFAVLFSVLFPILYFVSEICNNFLAEADEATSRKAGMNDEVDRKEA